MNLEGRYRRLLRLYPRDHRRVHTEEMIGVLMNMSAPGQHRPRFGEIADLAYGALRIRLRRAAGMFGGPWADSRAAAAVVALTAQALFSVVGALVFWKVAPLGLDLSWRHRTYVASTVVGAALDLRGRLFADVSDVLLTLLAALVATGAAAAALTGRRTIAATLAWVYAVAACGGCDVAVSANGGLAPPGTGDFYGYGLMVSPLAAVLIAVLASLPPGIRRGGELVNRRRLLLQSAAMTPLMAFYMVAPRDMTGPGIAISVTLLVAALAVPAGRAMHTPVGRRTLALLTPLAAILLKFCSGVDFGGSWPPALLLPLAAFYAAARSAARATVT